MTSPEMVLIQATTTYLEGSEHKSEHSAPYPATRSHGLELEAQGFARIVDPEQPTASADPDPVVLAPPAQPAEPAAPRRRGRPPGKRL